MVLVYTKDWVLCKLSPCGRRVLAIVHVHTCNYGNKCKYKYHCFNGCQVAKLSSYIQLLPSVNQLPGLILGIWILHNVVYKNLWEIPVRFSLPQLKSIYVCSTWTAVYFTLFRRICLHCTWMTTSAWCCHVHIFKFLDSMHTYTWTYTWAHSFLHLYIYIYFLYIRYLCPACVTQTVVLLWVGIIRFGISVVLVTWQMKVTRE